MSYQVLARKWRPRDFSEVVGQEHVVRALTNALDSDRLHHAYLFTGTRGVGKTTLARVLAKCFNCETGVSSRPCGECSACRELDEGRFVDLIEVDAASRARVDETRDLMDNVQFTPARGRFKVYLIDEVHMFSTHSFNALLKTLEEPPPHVKFLLATTDPQRLPVTVLSRCLQFNLKRVSVDDIAAQIEIIVTDEGMSADAGATRLLARAADGSLRDALSLLDQAIAYGAGTLETDTVQQMLGTLDQDRVFELLRALAQGDANGVMEHVAQMAAQALDFSTGLDGLLSTLQLVAKSQLVPGYAYPELSVDDQLKQLGEVLSPEAVQLLYQIGLVGSRDLPLSPDPQAGFEMVLLRMLAFRPADRPDSGSDGGGVGRTVPTLGDAPAPVPGSAASAQESEPAPLSSRQETAPEIPVEQPAPPQQPVDAADAAPPALEPSEWSRVVQSLDIAGLTRELASNSVLVSVDDDVIRVRLSNGHAHLNTAKTSAQLRAALSAYRGRETRLDVDLGEGAYDTPAEIAVKVAREQKTAAIAAIEGDPNVQSLLDAFEAVIDHDSVEPRSTGVDSGA